MSKKAKAITFILLIIIIGVLVILMTGLSLDLMSHLEGYKGYCSSVRLPAIFIIIITEISLTILLYCIYVYSKYYRLSKSFLKYTLPALILNAIFITYKIAQFPLLIKVSSIWNDSKTTKQPLHHPLLYVSIFYSIAFTLLLFKNRKILNQTYTKTLLPIIIFLLLTQVVLVLNMKYETCFG